MALTPVEVALAAVLDGVKPTEIEWVDLARADGRVLAEDLRATRTQPPFDAAAMDGWAVRAADATTAGARLAIVGEAAAGHGFAGSLGTGEAVRIFTGAPIPSGADTVVMQEHCRRDGDFVVLDEPQRNGRHLRRAGVDFREGDVGLTAGTLLDFTNLGLAAAMNHGRVPVRARPRVAMIATGDELVPPGTLPGPDQIVASNGAAIAALVTASGGEVIDLGIVRDDLTAIRTAIAAAFEKGIDALVTLGGASIGDHDLVHRALSEEGVDFDFWKIAMRPGKPLMYGRRGETRVVGLPGNPAAALVCGIVYVAPLVRTLCGRANPLPPMEIVPTVTALPANDVRQDHLRARFVRDELGRRAVAPLDDQDSSLLSRVARADALIVRPPHASESAVGELVRVLRLR